jgi:hypothetical protein
MGVPNIRRRDMANDRDNKSDSKSSSTSSQGADSNTSDSRLDRESQERSDKGFSAGMHSLDSTQVPLRSEDAEPDWDAIKGKGKPDSGKSDNK